MTLKLFRRAFRCRTLDGSGLGSFVFRFFLLRHHFLQPATAVFATSVQVNQRFAVMYQGRIVETGWTINALRDQQDDYTAAILAFVPTGRRGVGERRKAGRF